jgi:hypothetical protein
MGWGDEIMAAAQARLLYESNPQPVAILDKFGKPRSHKLWQGLDYIAQPGQPIRQSIVNGSSCRPYIDYNRTTKKRWFYTNWRASVGEIVCYRAPKRDYVVIEPAIKRNASPNKQWDGWQALVHARPAVDWVQLGPVGTRPLVGARHIVTNDFTAACAALSGARAAILPEGGLHHAAAALGVPAVVIFGSMVSPMNTGYDCQRNIYRPHDSGPCGWRIPCLHCQNVMEGISPYEVLREFDQL